VEQDDRLDQRELAMLWRLENAGRADRRAQLRGERFLSLFLQAGNGRSYIFRHGLDAANEELDVGDAELFMYERPQDAQIEYERMLATARRAGTLVDADSEEELGDPETQGPVLSETGIENERNT
jgi:hypothetical protein